MLEGGSQKYQPRVENAMSCFSCPPLWVEASAALPFTPATCMCKSRFPPSMCEAPPGLNAINI